MIVAGPNGSGKSSFYDRVDLELEGRSIRIVNPDLLAKRIRVDEERESGEANLEAVKRIQSWLDTSVTVYQTVGVETVLSTPKYRELVEKAQQRGFEIWLMFVILNDPERSVERVRIRVKKGGHPVDEDKIRARYLRCLVQMPWFLERADRAWLFDNSGAQPKLVGEKVGTDLSLDPECPDTLLQALITAGAYAASPDETET